MQKRSSLQPRPTKASMLRQQGGGTGQQQQQQQPKSRPVNVAGTSPVPQQQQQPTVNKRNSKAQASEGIRAFMAAHRAVAAQRKKTSDSSSSMDKHQERPKIRVMTGAERYSYDDSDPFGMQNDKASLKLQTVIHQAKSSGKLNLSNRNLDRVPDEVWSMYHVDPNKIVVDFSSTDDAWYDSTELNKLIAADNAITEIDERIGQEFGALTLVDFRNNKLEKLPESLRQLHQLTVLHLSHNQIEIFPEQIYDLGARLRDLDLSHNLLTAVPQSIERLSQLEILHLNDNKIENVADGIGQLVKLRKLYLNENQLVELPALHHLQKWTKLEEMHLFKNQLRVLFRGDSARSSIVVALPLLSRLDVRQNSLTQIVEGEKVEISLPKLKELLLAYNQLSQDANGLEQVMAKAPSVQTLDLSSNLFSEIPDVVLTLQGLRRLDVSANHLRMLRPDLGKLEHLAVLSWEGNPLRSAPRNVSMAELIESLRSKLVLAEDQEKEGVPAANPGDNSDKEILSTGVSSSPASPSAAAAAASSTPQSPRPSGTLDLSRKQLSDLEPSMLSGHNPATLQLQHNMLETIPIQPLSSCQLTTTLVTLKLDHNRLKELTLTTTTDNNVFHSLKTLSITNSRISQLSVANTTEQQQMVFPQLVELDISINALTSLPENLRDYLPSLRTLKANTNRIDKIMPQTLDGLEIIDLGNNDIAYLPPEIGRIGTIRELMLYGNRFRIPRPAVLDQGTGAVLEFLKRRLGS
ncbi:hypothetical protein BDB00DRAFT_586569 [Zychaea mexicana]|uniref:uncharacterized protein n=1 Tax=Zychaea mexicana TaxID=64656 RepID=UPI0022FDB10A|nr:uncharacterized protein BDB00DRAFT_586569 [Zychaea mexicana]KAI9497681.1 hypothetical protein BDB00DRAFT_586569 [Zychaea mexicana]